MMSQRVNYVLRLGLTAAAITVMLSFLPEGSGYIFAAIYASLTTALMRLAGVPTRNRRGKNRNRR